MCFGSGEGLRASAAVPQEQLVSGGVLFVLGNVTATETC